MNNSQSYLTRRPMLTRKHAAATTEAEKNRLDIQIDSAVYKLGVLSSRSLGLRGNVTLETLPRPACIPPSRGVYPAEGGRLTEKEIEIVDPEFS